MKRIISAFMILILIFAVSFSAFSFTIDGVDDGIEWDGATFYKLIDGESNSGVNFGLVKVKFDYDCNAVCLCFHFFDPELTVDNTSAGINITVDDSVSFEIIASDNSCSENYEPYSFDGAILIDDNNGATCEIRVGIKSGLPESIDFDARFIDSHGYYSDYHHFTVINELYETTVPDIIQPTADNTDPVYNPDMIVVPTEKTTRVRTTKAPTTKKTTTKKTTTKKSTTKRAKTETTYSVYETDAYSYTRRKATTAKKTETTSKMTKPAKTEKVKEKIYYYEKEIYISEVYVTQTFADSSTVDDTTSTVTVSTEEATTSVPAVSLSKGTKYKKILAVISLVAFIAIACFGTYSAKKSKNSQAGNE